MDNLTKVLGVVAFIGYVVAMIAMVWSMVLANTLFGIFVGGIVVCVTAVTFALLR
jgi:hypothetical protein